MDTYMDTIRHRDRVMDINILKGLIHEGSLRIENLTSEAPLSATKILKMIDAKKAEAANVR